MSVNLEEDTIVHSSKLKKVAIKAWIFISMCLALIGLPVFAGWHYGLDSVGHFFSAWSHMQFNTALCFLFISIGLVSTGYERKGTARFFGNTVATIAALTLIEYIFGINFGIDELLRKGHNSGYAKFFGRMAPNSAVSFVCIGLALSILNTKKLLPKKLFIVGLVSSLGFAFGAVTIISYWTKVSSAYGWGSYALMSIPTAIGFVVSGALLFTATIYFIKQLNDRMYSIPLYFTLILFLFSLSLWQMFLHYDAIKLNRLIEVQAESTRDRIVQNLETYALSVKRMAIRVEYLGIKDQKFLALDSSSYIKHLKGITRIGLVDSEYKVIWSYPYEISKQVDQFNQSSEVRRKAVFDFARSQEKLTISQTINLRSGSPGFLLPVPLYSRGKFSGFIYASITAQTFFDTILSSQLYQIGIYESETKLFQNKVEKVSADPKWTKQSNLHWGNIDWQIEVAPSLEVLQKYESLMHIAVLVVSIVISLLAGFFLLLFLISKEQKIEIAERDARFRFMVDGFKDYAIFMLDPNGFVTTWNVGAKNIKGYLPSEIIGQHFSKFYPQEDIDRDKPQNELRIVKETGSYEEEGWRVRKNGTQFWASVVITKVRDSSGHLLGYAKITRDLTAQKKAAEEREELNIKLNIALNAASMGVWSLDLINSKAWRSENHDEIFGHRKPLNFWNHDTFMEHVIPEDRAKVELEFQLALQKSNSSVECQIRRADDHSIRWLSVESKTFYDSFKKPTHMIGIVKDITEQRQLKAEQWATTEWLKAIVDGANYSIISTDVNGIIQTFNSAAEKMLGYRADEVIYKKTPQIIHDYAEIAKRAVELSTELSQPIDPGFDVFVAKTRITKKSDENEWTYIRKDGSRFPVQLSVSALRDSQSKVTGYLGIAFDITEKKKTLDELKATTKKLKTIFDASPVGILVLDKKLKLTIWNPACEKIFGWNESEVLGKFLPYVPSDQVHEALETIERVNKSKEPIFFQSERNKKDGTDIKIESAAMPLIDDSGELNGLIAVITDVTEKDVLQKKLLEANQTLQSTLEKITEEQKKSVAAATEAESLKSRLSIALQSSHIGVWDWDIVSNFLTWDDRMYEMYGVQRSDFASAYDSWLAGLHSDDQERSEEEVQLALTGQKQFDTEFRVVWPDKTIKHIKAFGLVRRDESGKPIRMVGVNWDITQQKQIEQDLKDAQEKAMKASQAKSEFLANMSHEIRTPINGVIGMTGILLDTELNVEQKDYTKSIKRSAEALLTIINDILDFSKIEAGKLDLEEIEFDLYQTITDTVKSMNFSAKQKKLQILTFGVEKWPKYFIGDPGRLRQILTNLLSNAIKFSSKGHIEVRVIARPQEGRLLNNFRFEVKDEGIGISEKALNRMFQAFSQADASTTRRFGGTGLGLSICKRLVHLMGGEISVESKENKGSTFWFELSFRVGSEIQINSKEDKKANGKIKKKFRNSRILLAEDNIINQKVALKQLEKLGLHADAVANGKEVLEALKNIPYDLVLMDCQMPEVDGYEATRLIRKSIELPFSDIPIIAMTANVVIGDKERCLNAGMDGYIKKPVNINDLCAALETWLDKKQRPKKKIPVAQHNNTDKMQEVNSIKVTDKTVDWSVLEDLSKLDSGTGPSIVKELTDMFIVNTPEKIKLLKSFLGTKEHEGIRKEVHSLKSSGGNLGAMEFYRLCQSLEDCKDWNDSDKILSMITAIEEEFIKVSNAFERYFKKAA